MVTFEALGAVDAVVAAVRNVHSPQTRNGWDVLKIHATVHGPARGVESKMSQSQQLVAAGLAHRHAAYGHKRR